MSFYGKHIDNVTFIKNFISRNFFLRFATYIICGICSCYFFQIANILLFALAAISLVGATSIIALAKNAFLRSNIFHITFNSITFLLFFSFGGILTNIYTSKLYYDWNDTNSIYKIQITDVLKDDNKTIQFKAHVINKIINDSSSIVDRNVIIFFPVNDSLGLCIGDIIITNAKFSRPKNDPLSSFDYKKYLVSKNISATAYISPKNLLFIENKPLKGIIGWATNTKHYLSESLHNNHLIDADNYPIIASILLGDKTHLSGNSKAEFNAAGASHVLAVSGMHVGIFYGIYLLIFGRIMRRRNLKWRYILHIIIIILIWIYAFITGLSPSVVRASLMFSMFIIDDIITGERMSGKTFACAMIIMMIINPLVIFDIGFQLSFMAVASIIMFGTYISKELELHNVFQYQISQLFIIPISAQIGTAPLIILYFNQFPIYFLISNILISFLTPLIMYGGMALLLCSDIPFIGNYIAWGVNFCLDFFNHSISYIASFPLATVEGSISWWHLPFLYFFIVQLFLLIRIYSFRKLCHTLASLCLCIITIFAPAHFSSKHEYLLIPRSKSLIVNRIDSSRNIVFTSDSIAARKILSNIWLKQNSRQPVFSSSDSLHLNSFVYNDESYIIIRKNSLKGKYNLSGSPLEVDNIIIDYGVYPSHRIFYKTITPRKRIILSHGVSFYYIEKYRNLAKDLNVEFYSIRENGSLIE